MGSYLSKPITEKVSTDETNKRLSYGASSMQGWRTGQEDAHNCILDFDENTSMFAVYDGHGGPEVALYTAQHLPKYIREFPKYKDGDLEEALIESFLGFDAQVASDEAAKELQQFANAARTKSGLDKGDDSDAEENVDKLYKEADMPLEEIIEKYACSKIHARLKKAGCVAVFDSSTEVESASCSNIPLEEKQDVDEPQQQEATSSESTDVIEPDSSSKESEVKPEEKSMEEIPVQNGDGKTEEEEEQQNGAVGKKGKGKALAKTKGVKPKKIRPQRSSTQLYKCLLDASESEEDDEEDKSFQSPKKDSSEEGDDSEDESEEEEDDDDDEDDEEGDDTIYQNLHLGGGGSSDTGCTAVVAILRGDELYVANAGDSRCVVSRNGKAIEMSFDHKPEDVLEQTRVEKAGGYVSADGRINGGLNLSRAIGDHHYKRNTELSDREQVITALPDIKRLTINSDDDFMILACDGIWNSMTSQEVVDFVRPKLESNPKLSQVCEQLFDHCLAPDTLSDGAGCDNMTAIIVKFKGFTGKRQLSPEPETEEESKKRSKTEES